MAQAAYRDLAKRIEQPLHLGITEAGGLRSGTVKSAIGLGALLLDGIGDTIRISLAADPAEEARVAWSMLRSLRLRSKGINFIACPSCSRQNFDVISTVNALEARFRRHNGSHGCVYHWLYRKWSRRSQALRLRPYRWLSC